MSAAFGIDIGGSGIKGALVDTSEGTLITSVVTEPTPQPSTPQNVTKMCAELLTRCQVGPDVPVGVTLPAPVSHNRVLFIANLHQSWAGTDVHALYREYLGTEAVGVNDADAAGIAEARFGAAAGVNGTVLVTTLGTGIGSALILDGKLWPNSELGHLELDGKDAESVASSAQKTRYNLSYEEYAQRLQRYYAHVEMLLCPDLIVVGGGISANHDQFLPLLKLRAPIVPAKLRNTAGIIGAAIQAAEATERH
ncbi:polyphosphate--glucose phosphotransferase [Gleimia hominis]|uniref:polyphosphate--glucose phosphotransferase n=1 Tax=Gleimia hominis TaxID=595468 RepID=UPI000C7FB79C|nr:ROK family protein [Gleimia hominis]WIK65284.1 ROK family protein [Gleimia hominis]